MTAKTVNYTAEQTANMVEAYKNGATVDSLAQAMGKSVRSVVAKLSREGVYKAKEYKTKTGEAVVKKDALASELMLLLGLTEAEADSLAKANKTALAKVLAVVKANVVTDANDVS